LLLNQSHRGLIAGLTSRVMINCCLTLPEGISAWDMMGDMKTVYSKQSKIVKSEKKRPLQGFYHR